MNWAGDRRQDQVPLTFKEGWAISSNCQPRWQLRETSHNFSKVTSLKVAYAGNRVSRFSRSPTCEAVNKMFPIVDEVENEHQRRCWSAFIFVILFSARNFVGCTVRNNRFVRCEIVNQSFPNSVTSFMTHLSGCNTFYQINHDTRSCLFSFFFYGYNMGP